MHILNQGTYIKADRSSLPKRIHFQISIFIINYYYCYLLLLLQFCTENKDICQICYRNVISIKYTFRGDSRNSATSKKKIFVT